MVAFIPRVFRAVVASLVFTFIAVQPLDAQPSPAVRILDSHLVAALGDALDRSPTLRTIVGELERSDVIVHVIARPASARHPHAGRLAFVTTTGNRRFLRITIDARLADEQRASTLGHELYHAVEVAREVSVVDRTGFAALYRRVGQASHHWSQCFDTVGAQEAGQRVLAELRAARMGSAIRPRIRHRSSPAGTAWSRTGR